MASAALDGALREIARLGGGTVESYPQDTAGTRVSASFLRLGKNHWVVTRTVRPCP
ncbi:hypothetical protein ACWET9_23005 [Streptomyces sp. NPDC004059]